MLIRLIGNFKNRIKLKLIMQQNILIIKINTIKINILKLYHFFKIKMYPPLIGWIKKIQMGNLKHTIMLLIIYVMLKEIITN